MLVLAYRDHLQFMRQPPEMADDLQSQVRAVQGVVLRQDVEGLEGRSEVRETPSRGLHEPLRAEGRDEERGVRALHRTDRGAHRVVRGERAEVAPGEAERTIVAEDDTVTPIASAPRKRGDGPRPA